VEPDDLKFMLDTACSEWERQCTNFLNLSAKQTAGAVIDEWQIEAAREVMRRALADFFVVVNQVDAGLRETSTAAFEILGISDRPLH
jgi:hypothetical protein